MVSNYSDKGARLSIIARKVDLHVATVRRILLVLCFEGFVTYEPVSKLYHLGPEIYRLSSIPQYSSIRDCYRLAIERIANKNGDTVYLKVRSGNDTLCIDRVEGNSSISVRFDIGMRLPMGLGASGLAILASLPDDEIQRILAANKFRYAHHANMTIEKVKELIKLARSLNYSLNEGNFQKGVTGVGLSIYNEREEPIGAITVASIFDRMSHNRCEEIAQLIKSEISLTQIY
jgi:DNA-binding IclR family transcriptional regulator